MSETESYLLFMNHYELDSLHNLFVFNGYFSEIYVNLLWNKLSDMENDMSLYFLQPQTPNVLYISSLLPQLALNLRAV